MLMSSQTKADVGVFPPETEAHVDQAEAIRDTPDRKYANKTGSEPQMGHKWGQVLNHEWSPSMLFIWQDLFGWSSLARCII